MERRMSSRVKSGTKTLGVGKKVPKETIKKVFCKSKKTSCEVVCNEENSEELMEVTQSAEVSDQKANMEDLPGASSPCEMPMEKAVDSSSPQSVSEVSRCGASTLLECSLSNAEVGDSEVSEAQTEGGSSGASAEEKDKMASASSSSEASGETLRTAAPAHCHTNNTETNTVEEVTSREASVKDSPAKHMAGLEALCGQLAVAVAEGALDGTEETRTGARVRIFTYLIGREAAFADNLKWMACANKGFFTQISTLADVQENVMAYLHVLSRPKVIDQEHDVVWTEAYVDSTLADDQGLVLMTTVAMPVFSRENETRSKGVLLGVVGTDVPVKELLKAIPKYKLGIHGYAFAITNNGYILTHPELRPLYEEGKKRRKPNYSSVDLSEVEWEDRDDVLRNAMVNRKTEKFSMEVKKTVDKGKRVLVMTNDYYYTDIKGTPFSLGVVLSRGHGKYFFRGNVTIEEGLHDLEHPDVSLADEWSYCNTDLHPEHRHLTQLEAIKIYLTGKDQLLQCDKELIQEVLFDAVVSAPLEAYWTSLALNKSENSDKGVEVAFLGTRTGLSRVNLFVGAEQLTNQDFLTSEDKESIFNADHFPLWYRRAAEQIPGSFVYSIPFSTGSENKSNVVTASTSIQLLDDRKSPVVAAVGIQMKLEFFQRKFWIASRQCATLDGKCPISCDDEVINCYLIDNNGFILVSEDYRQTGNFFGEVEGAVMNKLLNMGSFKRITLYDYQAMCRTTKESSDSAQSLLDPYRAIFAAIKWMMTELILFLVEFNLCNWWNSGHSVKAQRLKQVLEPCDTEYPAFVSERTIKETMGSVACDDCFKSFVIQQIPSSNLFMVVVDNVCSCDSFTPITMAPIEIRYNESLKCERLKSQKIRRRPEACHGFHPEENARECGGAFSISPQPMTVLLSLLMIYVSR
ncbi:voltage-dependent calcium channel subunit alpha-2/delta-3 isoform X8 [Xenopus laevis]|uniref:Voltage-dependent calcium channel subunit alpha-2/delta-3 isoform X8 n=1 Tax=Xenopus laevis TaxID=8355 RepID=A0A8J1N066_XENLA|nr:voltage-dependent calcium channel subunit alpha-2/delta-3 isoform X8 [Xenopus laevis]